MINLMIFPEFFL